MKPANHWGASTSLPADTEGVELTDLFPLTEAPERLPLRKGKRIYLAQVYRWAKRGLGGVRLRTVKVGGTQYTCERWLWAFLNRESGPEVPQRITSPARERRELDRVEARLTKMGILK
jgi:hypothetical protein